MENKELIKVVDVLGREASAKTGAFLFYIYNDGTIEKKYFIK
jgi:hypothetical protein